MSRYINSVKSGSVKSGSVKSGCLIKNNVHNQDITYCRSRGGGNPAQSESEWMTYNLLPHKQLSVVLPELIQGLDSRLRGNDKLE